MGDVDFVVTYVNGNDAKWRAGYDAMCGREGRQGLNKCRYRDWGFLRYILRGVETCLPWIRTVHLVVEQESQVPKWVDRKRVNVVTHDRIIPERYLPTYNSTAIEMYLWRIPGLSERFLYANDDMIPVNPMGVDEFYDDAGNPKLAVFHKPRTYGAGMYSNHLYNGEWLVRQLLGMERAEWVTRTGHNIAPMLRPTWELLHERCGLQIRRSLTPFRNKRNINQELCSYWQILTGNYTEHERRTVYMELNDIGRVCDVIEHTKAHLICINDNRLGVHFAEAKQLITDSLKKRFPAKSKYEI